MSNRRPKATLIKTEVADSGDDSLDSDVLQPLPSHTFTGNHHHHRRHTTTTTTTIHHSNYHDYTTLPEVDENNNVMTWGSSRRIAQSRSAPVTGGEKGQKKKPGRKKGQGQLYSLLAGLLSCCFPIVLSTDCTVLFLSTARPFSSLSSSLPLASLPFLHRVGMNATSRSETFRGLVLYRPPPSPPPP